MTTDQLNPNVRRIFDQVFLVVEFGISNRLRVPALVLVYSAIDVAAELINDGPPHSKKSFVKWVQKYISPERCLGCTALELYAARCGLVHGFTPVSGLSMGRKARKLLYAWAPSEVGKLHELNRIAELNQYAAVQGDQLCRAVKDGIEVFLADVEKQSSLLKVVNKNATSLFGHMEDAEVDQLLAWARQILC